MSSVARRSEDDSGEYSDASHENEQNVTGKDGVHPESDYESRSDSDVSEKEPDAQDAERRVDDDEDRSNPQYIPKRGTFYEHDDRTADTGEDAADSIASDAASERKDAAADGPARRPRKADAANRWSHDKFNENEQAPKSKDELVAIYGYDIRNEEAPPHARRNRRYGRGPNKYTRTWEDEEAYRRSGGAPRARPPAPEDFPELDARRQGRRVPRQRSKSQPSTDTSVDNERPELRRNASIKSPKHQDRARPRGDRGDRGDRGERGDRGDRKPNNVVNSKALPPKGAEKMPQIENLTITTSVNSNGPSPRQVGVAQQIPVATAQKKPVASTPAESPSQPPGKPHAAQQRAAPPAPPAQPPAANGAEGRPIKRYSSLRQRPLAEAYCPQPHAPRYQAAPEFPAGAPPAPHQASPAPQSHQQVHRGPGAPPPHGPSPPHQPLPPQHAPQQVRLLEQPLHHHQLHPLPQPHAMPQMPPAQGYAPPAMMPAQFMQSGNSGVFPPGPMYSQPPPTFPHQMYQHHNYQVAQVAQATQAGGVTYYSPVEQEAPAPRSQRRPTAAIPIVKPEHTERAPNTAEKDNIDRIVENMFVRRPWPATHAADAKEKSEGRSSQESTTKETKDKEPSSLTSSTSTETRTSPEKAEDTNTNPEPALETRSEDAPVQDTPPESIPTEA